jgi:hypothetical protein
VHVVRRRSVVRRRRSSVVRGSSVVRRSGMVRRSRVVRRSNMVRRRRRSLSVYQDRLRGATWLLLLLCPHRKMIGF